MCLCMVYLIALFMLNAAWSQRAPTWDACGCSWVAWQGWSTCSRLCYGRQVRERQVWVSDRCGTFRHCDGGDGAYDYRDCNTHCTYGSYDSSYGGCRCPARRYGTCCDNVITCGTPQTTSNGAYTVSNGNNFGSVATYTCTNGYNITGTATMTCSTYNSTSTYGNWTGSAPRCLFAESCNSSPCQNGGTCVNGLEMYTCVCSPGWSGINCEADEADPIGASCGILGSTGSCDDVSAIKEQYMASLKKSDFNPACLKHMEMCVPASVNVRC